MLRSILLSALVVLLAPDAAAIPVTVTFSGTIAGIYDAGGSFSSVAAGSEFSGSYQLEAETADRNPDDSVGHYLHAISDVRLHFAEHTAFNPAPLSSFVEVLNATYAPNVDAYSACIDCSHPGDASVNGAPGFFGLEYELMSDHGETEILTSDALIVVPPRFPHEALYVEVATDAGDHIHFHSSSFVIAPEPSSALLSGLGLACLAAMRRWRS